MELHCVATISCDEHDNGQECTATAEHRGPITQDTQGFTAEARKAFEQAGWRVGGGMGFCLCPRHNQQAMSKPEVFPIEIWVNAEWRPAQGTFAFLGRKDRRDGCVSVISSDSWNHAIMSPGYWHKTFATQQGATS
jgi:hypothetical protein